MSTSAVGFAIGYLFYTLGCLPINSGYLHIYDVI